MKIKIFFPFHTLAALVMMALTLPSIVQGQTAWRLAEVHYGPIHEQASDQLYEWEVVVQQADARGGELNLIVAPRSAPTCRRVYWMSWSFDQDISIIREGETINVSMFSRPAPLPQDCEWDSRGLTPGRLMLVGGHYSPLIEQVTESDIGRANWPYVCLVPYPEPVVWSEPPAKQWQDIQLHSGSGTIRIGGRTDEERELARTARGGAFMFRIGDQGVHFQVVYRFTKMEPPAQNRQQTATAQIAAPVVRETRRTEDAMYWLGIEVPDILQNVRGRQIQLIVHFVDVDGQPLPAYYGEEQYVNAEGFAAVSSPMLTSDQSQFYLSDLNVWMPYYALNLPYSGGRDTHQLFMYAEVLVDGKVAAVSPYVALRVDW